MAVMITRRRARRGAGNESDTCRYVHHHLFLLLHLPLSPRYGHDSRQIASVVITAPTSPPASHRLTQPHVHHLLFLLHHLSLSVQIWPRQPPHREHGHHSRHVTSPPSHHLTQPQNQPNGQLAASARVEEGEGLRETGEERGWVGCRVSQNSPPPSHHLEKCMVYVN